MALSRVTFLMDDGMRAEFEADMQAAGHRTQQEAFESMFRCKKASKAVVEDDEDFEGEEEDGLS